MTLVAVGRRSSDVVDADVVVVVVVSDVEVQAQRLSKR
jgi:hypothetical protein